MVLQSMITSLQIIFGLNLIISAITCVLVVFILKNLRKLKEFRKPESESGNDQWDNNEEVSSLNHVNKHSQENLVFLRDINEKVKNIHQENKELKINIENIINKIADDYKNNGTRYKQIEDMINLLNRNLKEKLKELEETIKQTINVTLERLHESLLIKQSKSESDIVKETQAKSERVLPKITLSKEPSHNDSMIEPYFESKGKIDIIKILAKFGDIPEIQKIILKLNSIEEITMLEIKEIIRNVFLNYYNTDFQKLCDELEKVFSNNFNISFKHAKTDQHINALSGFDYVRNQDRHKLTEIEKRKLDGKIFSKVIGEGRVLFEFFPQVINKENGKELILKGKVLIS